jgi:glycosidase
MESVGQDIARISGLCIFNSFENKELSMAIQTPIQFLVRSPKIVVPSDVFDAKGIDTNFTKWQPIYATIAPTPLPGSHEPGTV